MEIKFCGAARSVTGSRHLLSVNGRKILVDCGLYQGRRKETYENNKNFLFDPHDVDVMLLTHAHIDHSGNIPNLVKNGFDGPIYATGATVDLCQIMLRDSAYLQERDVEWVNKRRVKRGEDTLDPIYTISDAENAMKNFIGVQYDRAVDIAPGVKATFRDAGHILGSASILLEINENGKKRRLGFSGDVGRKEMPILHDPNKLRNLDVFVVESTYGDRLHRPSGDVEDELAEIVNKVVQKNGKIIIPAFAVGRTQMIVYLLHKLFDQNRIPNLPIYVDSPLACNATDVFRTHPECMDRETYRLFLRDHEDPFGFGRLTYIRDVEDSKRLNSLTTPHIIISASGMAEGGRILHHLRNNIGDPNVLVLFVGYAAQHTLARRLMDGDKEVRIFGEEHVVRCDIRKMEDFSAHADRNELFDYMEFLPPSQVDKVILVHGETDQALPMKDRLEKRGYSSVLFPALGETVEL